MFLLDCGRIGSGIFDVFFVSSIGCDIGIATHVLPSQSKNKNVVVERSKIANSAGYLETALQNGYVNNH